MKSKKYYVYVVSGKSGITDSWPECQKIVSGVPGARFKGFAKKDEAEKWLDAGADYSKKHIDLEPGIYFDAGTGAGNGVEIRVCNEKEKDYLKELLGREVTNNFGELMACKKALEFALENKVKKIFGDSKLVIEYWSNGFIKKDNLPQETIDLAEATKKLRYKFEKSGGVLALISGDNNPADLGFHK